MAEAKQNLGIFPITCDDGASVIVFHRRMPRIRMDEYDKK